MRYELLGTLRVVDDEGSSRFVSALKLELLLLTLLARADRVVTAESLIGELWEGRPPRRATAGLHVYISELRKFLKRPDGAPARIVTRSPGYQLALDGDELDHQDFLDLMTRGRNAMRAGQPAEAVEHLERALALWRGPACSGVGSGPILNSFRARLTESRLECTEILVDCQLELGRHRELVGMLSSLTAEHPLRESFHRQLMLALYRSERRAEALDVYRRARRTLIDELGLEPCRPLRELHEAILHADDLDGAGRREPRVA